MLAPKQVEHVALQIQSSAHKALSFPVLGVPVLAYALLFLLSIFLCFQGLNQPGLEGLDGASHVMDGVFFYDFYRELPLSQLSTYPFDYKAQYPALGFGYWPPLFPAIEGLVMLVFGGNIFAAHVTIFLFTLILAFSVYKIARFYVAPCQALLGSILFMTSTGVYPYFNTAMLEAPCMAAMALSAALYLSILHRHQAGKPLPWWLWTSLTIVASSSVYIKQTAFVVPLAIALDVLVLRRDLFRYKGLWFSAIASLILVLPLAAFTLTVGQANIEQSLGNNTAAIMGGYEGLSRLSIANWTYYIGNMKNFLGPLSALLFFIGLPALFKHKGQGIFVLISWILVFYFCFSYFDNKQDRFGSLVAIPCYIIACMGLAYLMKQLSSSAASLGLAGLVLIMSGYNFSQGVYYTVDGIAETFEQLEINNKPGNLLYFGQRRQPFVYYLRANDAEKDSYFIDGTELDAETLTKVSNDQEKLKTFIQEKNIKAVIAELEQLSPQQQAFLDQLAKADSIEQIAADYLYRETPVVARAWKIAD